MKSLHLRLPATSANLGPGFDTAALALDLYLDIEAEPADQHSADQYVIHATGRNPDICGSLHHNLLLSTYEETLRAAGRQPRPLRLIVRNQIPIGMGCGSSAAVRIAGLLLAIHFGQLGWTASRLLEEACRLEHHPDNAAACWLGGFTVAASEGASVRTVSIKPPAGWTALLVVPDQPLPTSAARAVLPDTYSRQDTVANLQNLALLTAAFHTGRGDLLRHATRDRLHQPYRHQVCPLLPLLLPLVHSEKILSVSLSGAGPSVLVLVSDPAHTDPARAAIQAALQHQHSAEILTVTLAPARPAAAWLP